MKLIQICAIYISLCVYSLKSDDDDTCNDANGYIYEYELNSEDFMIKYCHNGYVAKSEVENPTAYCEEQSGSTQCLAKNGKYYSPGYGICKTVGDDVTLFEICGLRTSCCRNFYTSGQSDSCSLFVLNENVFGDDDKRKKRRKRRKRSVVCMFGSCTDVEFFWDVLQKHILHNVFRIAVWEK